MRREIVICDRCHATTDEVVRGPVPELGELCPACAMTVAWLWKRLLLRAWVDPCSTVTVCPPCDPDTPILVGTETYEVEAKGSDAFWRRTAGALARREEDL